MSDSSHRIDMDSINLLVPKARDGDKQAHEAICRQVQDYLQMMATQHLDPGLRRKLNPSDIVQQTMTRMIHGFENFRGKTSAEFYGWLTQILKNEIHTIRRDLHRAKRDVKRETELDGEGGCDAAVVALDPTATPGTQAIRAERKLLLATIMKRLPADMEMVIRLRTLEGLPFQQVADEMEKTYDATYKLWKRAIIQFQSELNNQTDSMS